jgi:iron complex outermembrane receptor protein
LIPQLKQEESQVQVLVLQLKYQENYFNSRCLYRKIKDRVLTDQFSRPGGTPAAGTPLLN